MTDIQELFEELHHTTKANHLIEDFEEQLQLPDKIGKGHIQNWHLREGLELYTETYQCQEDTVFESSVQHSFLKLGFCISGAVHGLEPDFVMDSGQSLLLTRSTDIKARTAIAAKQPICVVEVVIPPQLLSTMIAQDILPPELQQVLTGFAPGLYAKAGTITPPMAIALHQILNCPYQGFTKQLYLESKALELITLQFADFGNSKPETKTPHCLGSEDINCIYKARSILIQQIDQPPSLLSLARQVGLNDYKLKLGFRQVFGTTVFGYLHQYRMEQARQLLETSKLKLEIISQAVGYASLSSFHRAFKKQFGINPGAYRANDG
jgi:AraC-like DNA-binding protein